MFRKNITWTNRGKSICQKAVKIPFFNGKKLLYTIAAAAAASTASALSCSLWCSSTIAIKNSAFAAPSQSPFLMLLYSSMPNLGQFFMYIRKVSQCSLEPIFPSTIYISLLTVEVPPGETRLTTTQYTTLCSPVTDGCKTFYLCFSAKVVLPYNIVSSAKTFFNPL